MVLDLRNKYQNSFFLNLASCINDINWIDCWYFMIVRGWMILLWEPDDLRILIQELNMSPKSMQAEQIVFLEVPCFFAFLNDNNLAKLKKTQCVIHTCLWQPSLKLWWKYSYLIRFELKYIILKNVFLVTFHKRHIRLLDNT